MILAQHDHLTKLGIIYDSVNTLVITSEDFDAVNQHMKLMVGVLQPMMLVIRHALVPLAQLRIIYL